MAGLPIETKRCRECGCTESTPCVHPDYGPCSWHEGEDPPLCTFCAIALQQAAQRKAQLRIHFIGCALTGLVQIDDLASTEVIAKTAIQYADAVLAQLEAE